MIIIIDSYNLIHCCFENSHETDKKYFIKNIEKYLKTTKHTYILVFDGGSHACTSRHHLDPRLIIVHSGYTSSADEYITKVLSREYKGYECLLVTYDRELIKHNTSWTHIQPPQEFWNIVKETTHSVHKKENIKKNPSCIKYYKHEDQSNCSDEEIDTLMQRYTQKIMHKSENEIEKENIKKITKKTRGS